MVRNTQGRWAGLGMAAPSKLWRWKTCSLSSAGPKTLMHICVFVSPGECLLMQEGVLPMSNKRKHNLALCWSVQQSNLEVPPHLPARWSKFEWARRKEEKEKESGLSFLWWKDVRLIQTAGKEKQTLRHFPCACRSQTSTGLHFCGTGWEYEIQQLPGCRLKRFWGMAGSQSCSVKQREAIETKAQLKDFLYTGRKIDPLVSYAQLVFSILL